MVNIHRHPENTVVEGIEVYYYPLTWCKTILENHLKDFIDWNINDFNISYFLNTGRKIIFFIIKLQISFEKKKNWFLFILSYQGKQYQYLITAIEYD